MKKKMYVCMYKAITIYECVKIRLLRDRNKIRKKDEEMKGKRRREERR